MNATHVTPDELNAEALAIVQATPLSEGSHRGIEHGMCVMEAVAFVAGEPWSDEPACACPVISAFLRSWNDALPSDAERDRILKPLVPTLIGTRSTSAVEQRRATMAADWLIRVHTPAWLRLAKLDSQASALESLPEITDFAQCPSLMPTLNSVREDAPAARDAARAGAWDAAWAAARAVAWDAAWAAAWAAASDAASAAASDAASAAARDAAWAAARDAAWAAASAAAWAAARDAASAAASDALQTTTQSLQDSAVELVKRMCEVQE